ncbi:alginate lyase family protein [Flavobacterium panacis]|uniref:alginate lyase family protein n=1 Tax=Flavobacterium panacis TaxID=2962567 RepID=UPI00214D332E|nr:alginate lyase family protein [Flavobacterium panacis]MCR4030924.1 heparinase II/III family protein [Flavobacterium panacis]
MKLKLGVQLFYNMGLRYTSYRILHEIEKRTGVLEKRHPYFFKNPSSQSLEKWRLNTPDFVIKEREKLTFLKSPSLSLKEKVNLIKSGSLLFFNREWIEIGKNYDWLTNPVTNYKYNNSLHWSKIQDFSAENGDIKYVWEKSRFSYLLTIIRNDYHNDEDNSSFVFDEIENWIKENPINQGPNWKCSQEISLRIFNWCYALYFYKNSNSLTEKRWSEIQNVIYASLHHVYYHINFSRIAVRNNHAITETLFLTLSEFLFPFIPETKKWAKKGRKWFEKEIKYQIYPDGTFLQFSMNYHRVLIQLFSLGLSITERHKKRFSPIVYNRAELSLNFLFQCLQDENGYLPNYGANDGALFFPLTESDYRDYRPQLNTLHQILKGIPLFDDVSEACQDFNWLSNCSNGKKDTQLKKKQGIINFPYGGYYLIRDSDTFTFIRCGKHKDRPAHADNLHVDVWYKGINYLRDSGTYKYNTSNEMQQYFTGTGAHNSVTIEHKSQMLKGSRFIWFYWSQAIKAKLIETESTYIFEGSISAFRYLNPKARHSRTLIKSKGKLDWEIEDRVDNLDNNHKNQIWHFDENNVKFHATIVDCEVQSNNIQSFNSLYYGEYKEGKAISFPFEKDIKTKINIQ